MNALARTDYAPLSLSEAVVSEFMRAGAYVFDERLSERACAALLADVRRGQKIDETLFLSEAEFDAVDSGAAEPRRVAEAVDGKLAFVERAPQIVEALWSLLGPDYRILDRQVVCLLPEPLIPAWIKRRLEGVGNGELSAFVRPERRDVSYRARLDLRQEPDAGAKPGEAVTLDLYLHSVTDADAPLRILEGSHRLGAFDAPANLARTGPGVWRYRNARLGDLRLTERPVIADAGCAVLRHGWTLSGDAQGAQTARISLQYRFGRGATRQAGVDTVNAWLAGPASVAAA